MDRYQVVRKIGEGSYGKALLVKRRVDGKHCVVKEVNISKMSKKERDEAKKEVKVLAQMKHPNIVSYLESFEDGGILYILMDYCDGGDLYSKINEQKGKLMMEEQVLTYFVQLCLALKHVHDRKILHRDIKSQNIFLTKAGILKLGDFGIARVLGSSVELARTCIGTPYYLSPEICENRPYNNKSDVWAMGCVLYELTTLKHAFEAGNMKNLLVKIVRGAYPPISPRYSKDLKALIDLCLRHNPRDRPSVNAVLRLPFIQKRIEGLLTETVRAEEFSHTTFHGKVPPPIAALPIAAPPIVVPLGGLPPTPMAVVGKPLQPVEPVKPVQPAKQGAGVVEPKKYDPSVVYGQRKLTQEKKKGVVVRPRPKPQATPGGGRHPPSEALAKRREVEEKAGHMDEQIRAQHKAEVEMQHQNFARRQQVARMQQAKQAAAANWQNTLSSSELAAEKAPLVGPVELKHADPIQGIHGVPSTDLMQNMKKHHQVGGNIDPHPLPVPNTRADIQRAERERVEASEVADRALVLAEFKQRQREVALNKARVKGSYAVVPQQQLVVPAVVPMAAGHPSEFQRVKDQAEKDYLAKLEAIRKQNYMDRRRVQERISVKQSELVEPVRPVGQVGQVGLVEPAGAVDLDPEARRRKVAMLKAQADQEADRMRKMVEERRHQRAVKEVESPEAVRRKWGDPVKVANLAQQYEATGVVVEGTSNIIFERNVPKLEGPYIPVMDPKLEGPKLPKVGGPTFDVPKVEGSKLEGPRMERPKVDAPKLEGAGERDGAKAEGGRRCWEEGQVDPVAALLRRYELQPGTYTAPMDPAGGTKIVFSHGGLVDGEAPAVDPRTPVSVKEPPSSPAADLNKVEKSDSWVCVGGDDRGVVSSEKIDTAAEHRSDVMPHPPSDGLGIVQKEPLVAAKQAWSNGGVAEGPQCHHHEEHESGGHRGSPEVQRSGSGQVRHQGVHEVHKDIQRVPPSEGMLVEDIEECLNESLTGTRGGRPQDVCVSPEPAQVEDQKGPLLEAGPAVGEGDQEVEEYLRTLQDQDQEEPCRVEESFQTAEEGLSDGSRSALLLSGQYDTTPKLLRTCSLPNLHQPLPDKPEQLCEPQDGSGDLEQNPEGEEDLERPEDGECSEVPLAELPPLEAASEVGGGPALCPDHSVVGQQDEDKPQSDDPGCLVGQKPAPTNPVDEKQGAIPNEEEEEEYGDDIHQLVCTLQSFVKEAKSPITTHSKDIASPLSVVEEWQSSDSEESSPVAKGCNSKDSVFSKLEETRATLEIHLGLGVFLEAYHLIQTFQDEAGDSSEDGIQFPLEQLTAIVGEEHTQDCPSLLQLVIADCAYSERNREDLPIEFSIDSSEKEAAVDM